jgi:ABC-type glycerol-3-phosphate transport system substrate-binding protein
MVMDGSWMVGIWSAEPPFDFGTATMPYPSDGTMATNMGGEQGFVMAEDPAAQQAAFDFLAWFTSPEVQVEWDELESELTEAVRSARQAQRSWSEIGTMLGVSKQAARRKYSSKVTA